MKVTTSTEWIGCERNQNTQPTEPASGTPISKVFAILFFSTGPPAITPRGGATATGWSNREIATANAPILHQVRFRCVIVFVRFAICRSCRIYVCTIPPISMAPIWSNKRCDLLFPLFCVPRCPHVAEKQRCCEFDTLTPQVQVLSMLKKYVLLKGTDLSVP